jgi:hypothetical protein
VAIGDMPPGDRIPGDLLPYEFMLVTLLGAPMEKLDAWDALRLEDIVDMDPWWIPPRRCWVGEPREAMSRRRNISLGLGAMP